jgi:hypothetical protein
MSNANPDSNRARLNVYIHQLHQRLRLGVSLRGVAILMATALVTTVLLVLVLNAFAFPLRGLTGARSLLLIALACAAALAIALPLLRLTRSRATAVAESAYPEFQQRLLTFDDREKKGNDPFLELLAADTLSVARQAQPVNLVSNNKLYFFAGAGAACVAVLVWLVAAGPGYLGYGASLLWTGPKSTPLYDIRVTPGDVAVRRNSDQLITASIIGLKPDKVRLFAHYKSSGKGAWEPVAMQSANASDFQFVFAGLPEDVDYYVEAGPLTSRHYKVRVVDLPSVKQLKVTYRYPKWTGVAPVSEDRAGDLRALEGTSAELTLKMDRPLHNGQLTLDDGKQIALSGGEDNIYKGSILMQKDGAYHVAAVDQGQPVRLSEDYFIATDKANPPEIAIDRPAGDYRASPIEEVSVGVKASDQFALSKVSLHYSVNGGPEKSIDLPQQAGAKEVTGSTTLSLEDFKLIPGDLVSLYATAKDGHTEARTDMAFIQADPFEREFSQSQQMAGGGGGGGMGSQTDISKREKELIAATWKRQNDKSATAKDAAQAGTFLSGVQSKLQEQALALAARMDSRDLSSANEEFNSFGHDMQAAASAMTPSSDKLKQMQWHDAIPAEQKALQYLLRAEATFRKIQVAFGQQGGGGGGGGGAGRDLASLFDLELDTEKNQYETAQTGSAAEQRAKAVDDALAKLDALARRQEELAQQQRNQPQSMQERWQQEMLRRQAEELQRQMEQMAQNGQQEQQGQQGQQGRQGQQGQQGKQSANSSSGGSSSGRPQSSGSQSSSAGSGNAADPRVAQALNRLRNADEAMKQSAGQQRGSEAARRAADQLRQAAGLMSGAQQQQFTGKLDSLSRESDRLSKEERAQADRIRGMTGQSGVTNQEQYSARIQQRNKLAEDRQQLSDDLAQLEKNLRSSARELAPTQPQSASKLRDALGGIDQTDLTNRVQRSADWLRRGVNPNTSGVEEGIGKGLEQLSQQVHEAQQGLGPAKPGQGASPGGEQTAALDHVERFRDQVQSLTEQGQNSLGRQPGQQPGQGAQQGRANQGRGGSQGGPGTQIGGGNQVAQDHLSGDLGNQRSGGGAAGTAWNNINTGNNHFDRNGLAATGPDTSPVTADPERTYQQGMSELSQLHHLAQNDPAALKQIQELVQEMQRLDPRRFPGNPIMVEQLHAEVLSGVDKLELQLRHDGETPGQVRTTKEPQIPPGYEEAVADYYRRLSKGQE